jgi:hypothetical protein
MISEKLQLPGKIMRRYKEIRALSGSFETTALWWGKPPAHGAGPSGENRP